MIGPSLSCYYEKEQCHDRLAGALGGQNPPQGITHATTMEVEQRYVITFVADEGLPGVEIISRSGTTTWSMHALERKCTGGSMK
jgi:hypothetical protein